MPKSEFLINFVRVFAITLWAGVIKFLTDQGFDISNNTQELLVAATVSLLLALVLGLAKKYPKYFGWIQYLLIVPTPPTYTTPEEPKQ